MNEYYYIEPLTPEDKESLAVSEAALASFSNSFFERGKALNEIRARRLFRDNYISFGAYCKDKWCMTRQRAFQLIEASTIMKNLLPLADEYKDSSILPRADGLLRPLCWKKLVPERQREIWKAVIEKSRREDFPVTIKMVKGVFEEMSPNSYNKKRDADLKKDYSNSKISKELKQAFKYINKLIKEERDAQYKNSDRHLIRRYLQDIMFSL